MSFAETLSWPFFEEHHRGFANELARWADATLPGLPHDDVDAACRARVAALGRAGFLAAVVPGEFGGLHPRLPLVLFWEFHSSRVFAASQVVFFQRWIRKRRYFAPFSSNSRQWDAANKGLPPASLICDAHTFWIAVTTLLGIGT